MNTCRPQSSVILLTTLCACLAGGFAACLSASEPSPFTTNAPVAETAAPAPHATRVFNEADLLPLLTSVLQQEYVKDKGELELKFNRPWIARTLPDEAISLKVTELPAAGVTPSFIVRFELRTDRETLGVWQAVLQAKVWREVWVAHSALKRGDQIADTDISRERRDVLSIRDAVADFVPGDTSIELAEPLQSGSVLLGRSVKPRAVMRRGQFADALVRDGTLSISMKVEVLEDGAPGQIIHARNPQSRRDLRGKVLNEQTILIAL